LSDYFQELKPSAQTIARAAANVFCDAAANETWFRNAASATARTEAVPCIRVDIVEGSAQLGRAFAERLGLAASIDFRLVSEEAPRARGTRNQLPADIPQTKAKIVASDPAQGVRGLPEASQLELIAFRPSFGQPYVKVSGSRSARDVGVRVSNLHIDTKKREIIIFLKPIDSGDPTGNMAFWTDHLKPSTSRQYLASVHGFRDWNAVIVNSDTGDRVLAARF
jgi:hypothetical protein